MKRGFTLTELLVTMGIIAVLVAILLPTVAAVRRAAYAADTKNTISQISSAIERYHLDHRAYPGVFSNDQVASGVAPVYRNSDGSTVTFSGPVTASENLVLSLMGGIRVTYAGRNVTAYEFDPSRVGQGAVNIIPRSPRQFSAYLPANERMLSDGRAGDTIPGMNDGEIPEIMDGWPHQDRMPILYMRARAAASGVIADGPMSQYNRTHLGPYLRPEIGSSPGDWAGDGLQGLGASGAEILDGPFVHPLPTPDPRLNALSYFTHPVIADTPVNKDGFVLIAPGPDRTYGTRDDIRSWAD